MAGSDVLLIDRGDLPSLAACATHAGEDEIVLWHQLEPDAAAARRRAAVTAHARAWRIERVISSRRTALGVPGMAAPPGLAEASMLLQAMAAAGQIGCSRVVWPVRAGLDGDAIAIRVERVELVTALASEAGAADPVRIEMPLIDLTDPQIAEIADDAGAPMRAFWPCREAGERPCDRCPECSAWRAAFDAAGLDWPWAGTPVAAPLG